MAKTWITIFALCIVYNASSQDLTVKPTTYELGISIGLNLWQVLDKNTSPLSYQSRQTDVGLHFKYYRNHSMVTVGLKGAIGQIQPKDFKGRSVYFIESEQEDNASVTTVPANGSLITLRFDLGYQYIFNPEDAYNRFGAGVILSDELYNPNGFTRPGLMNIASINPSVYYEHLFSEKQSVHIMADVPVYSLITRMPYDNTVSLPDKSPIAGLFEKGTESGSWKNYKGANLTIGYKGKLSDNLNAGLDYVYQVKSIAEPKMLKMQNNIFLASFLYEF